MFDCLVVLTSLLVICSKLFLFKKGSGMFINLQAATPGYFLYNFMFGFSTHIFQVKFYWL